MGPLRYIIVESARKKKFTSTNNFDMKRRRVNGEHLVVAAKKDFTFAQRRAFAIARKKRELEAHPREVKFLDTAISDGTLASTMVHFNICVVPQGTDEQQRVGRKILVRKIHFKGVLTLVNSTAITNTSNVCKVMVVQDKQTNGAQLATAQLLETDVIASFNNLTNRSRFRVLRTEYYTFSQPGGVATAAAFALGEVSHWVDINLDCKIPIEYDDSATTGAITTVRSSSLWVIFQTSTSETVSVGGQARIRYLD